uniref:anthranilate synthase n=2 Tax=Archaeoglobus fulgidus TaxID=2234 RepID=A0A7C3MA30_ARCFL
MQKHEFVEPVKLYAAVRDEDYPFILESAEKSGRARYSYISFNPLYTIRIDKRTKVDGEVVARTSNPFDALREIHVKGLLVGYVAYDAVNCYVGKNPETPSVFGCYDGYFVYDHYLRKLFSVNIENAERIVERAKRISFEEEKGDSSILKAGSKEEFVKMVEKGKEQIQEGEVYQIVLSREYVIDTDMSPFQMYINLRKMNPSPYMFLLEFDRALIGSSPETMGRVEGRNFIINPIAGTARRERGREKEIASALLKDEKERAEHVMLVDLARNDVRKVCKSGSVRVTKFMEVVEYPGVLHIESEVVGELKSGMTHFDAMKAAFPAGTVTGAPKLRAIELIDSIEKDRRSVYAGAVGYFSDQVSDLAIAIRMIEYDGKARIRAGAGIVADSIPEKEFLETENKIANVLRAVGL